MKVALISLDQVWENKIANRILVQEKFNLINDKEVDLVIFPEMTMTGFTMNSHEMAESLNDSESIQFFRAMVKKHNCAVIFGIIIKEERLPTNRLIFMDRNGEVLSAYSKVHPFSVAGELNHYSKGTNIVISNFEGGRVGSTICFDLRFPELFQALSKDCSVIINIANWPAKRVMHWDTLLRARAIENQVVMIGVNRTGLDGNGIEYQKSSVAYNANGDRIASIKVAPCIDIIEFEVEDTANVRSAFPVKNDRQVELYKKFL